MITNKDVYRCYSVNLMQYLTSNNIRYFLIAIDVVSHKKFWAYERTNKFNELLEDWIHSNPKNKQ